jgi:hypothetical protein
MKGISLPINVIVIIVLAMIVLLAVIALFFGVWKPEQLTVEAAKNNACNMLVSTGCDSASSIVVRDFDANQDGEVNSEDTLLALCDTWYNIDDDFECRKTICRCE